MCELCSDDEDKRKQAREQCEMMADRLRHMARAFDDMATGGLKPHGKELSRLVPLFKSVIRELVAEWV